VTWTPCGAAIRALPQPSRFTSFRMVEAKF
jgi:hypothetical protein